MSRMTDEELFSVKRAGEVAYKEKAARDRVSVIYQSDMIMAGYRAIESEYRRMAFLEAVEIADQESNSYVIVQGLKRKSKES